MTTPRTNSANVQTIIDWDSSISLDPFMLTASLLVTDYCTGAKGPTVAYTDERLELIERWLTAHFYTIRDKAVDTENVGPIQNKYVSKTDLLLMGTMYGQQAMLIDSNGGLAALNKSALLGKRMPSIKWLGRDKVNDPDADEVI